MKSGLSFYVISLGGPFERSELGGGQGFSSFGMDVWTLEALRHILQLTLLFCRSSQWLSDATAMTAGCSSIPIPLHG